MVGGAVVFVPRPGKQVQVVYRAGLQHQAADGDGCAGAFGGNAVAVFCVIVGACSGVDVRCGALGDLHPDGAGVARVAAVVAQRGGEPKGRDVHPGGGGEAVAQHMGDVTVAVLKSDKGAGCLRTSILVAHWATQCQSSSH